MRGLWRDLFSGAGCFGCRMVCHGVMVLSAALSHGAEGDFFWATATGGTGTARGTTITVDDVGNVYTVGIMDGTVDFNPGPGTHFVTAESGLISFVAKSDSGGAVVWVATFGGGVAGSQAIPSTVAVDAAGNVYLGGDFAGTPDFAPGPAVHTRTSTGYKDAYLSKLGPDGTFQWVRTFGSSGNDNTYEISVDHSGNVYAVGQIGGTVDFDPGVGVVQFTPTSTFAGFVLKLDGAGQLGWAKLLGGANSGGGQFIALDGVGNIYAKGYYSGSNRLWKHDPNGGVIWSRIFPAGSGSGIRDFSVDNMGNAYSMGAFQNTVDFDPGAGTFQLTAASGGEIFVSKLDNDGNFAWARAIGAGSDLREGAGIAVAEDGNSYITGSFAGTMDFDPGAGIFPLTSFGGTHTSAFMLGLDGAGDFKWVQATDGPGNAQAKAIAVSPAEGHIHAVGQFGGTVDFDAAGPGFALTALESEYFVSTYNWKLSGPPNNTPPNATSVTFDAMQPNHGTEVFFNIGFDELVQNFDEASDLVIVHSGTSSTGATISGGAGSYKVKILGVTGEGSLSIAVDTASDVQDLDGNPLASSVTSEPVPILPGNGNQGGGFVWAVSMFGAGSGGSVKVESAVVDGAGNVYTTGYFYGTVDFDPGAGEYVLSGGDDYSPFVSKFDSNGALLWAVVLEGSSWGVGYAIDLDPSGNVYVSGYFTGTMDFWPGSGTHNLISTGSEDFFVLKLDSSGNFVWARAAGGVSGDRSYGVVADASGVYAVGVFRGTVDFGPGSGTVLTAADQNDAFILKYNANGTLSWARSIGGTSYDGAHAIDLDVAGNLYFCGDISGIVDLDPGSGISYLSAPGQSSSFVASWTGNGEFLWANGWGEAVGVGDIMVGADGSIGMSGGLYGTAELVTAGGTTLLTSVGEEVDVFVGKLDGAGNLLWATAMGGEEREYGFSVVLDQAGNVYTTGQYRYIADFNPGPGVFELTALGTPDTFVSKLDSDGNFVWAKPLGGQGETQVSSMGIDSEGALYVVGDYFGTIDFDPGEEVYYQLSWDTFSGFIVKLEAGEVEETGPPVLSLLGDSSAYVDSCLTYTDAGATAIDVEDGDLTASIVVNSTVNTSVPGTYEVTYDVTDSDGASAIQVVRVVHVIVADSDDDGLENCQEVSLGTNPLHADTDGDGMPDGVEVGAGTDPLNDASYSSGVYVDGASGSDTAGNGSQANPWATVAHAVASVVGSAENIVTVYVAEGVYTMLNSAGGALHLDSHEHLLGGHESAGWTRDTQANVTVLDGAVAVGGNPAANVVVLDGVVNATLDGFTVTGADSSGTNIPDGAGILGKNLDASSSIVDCLVTGNTGNEFGGGGIRLVDASPAITGCVIAENYTDGQGGGLSISGESDAPIDRCVIGANRALGGGGGVYIEQATHPVLSNCVISGNITPTMAGGGVFLYLGAVSIVNCTMAYNSADQDSGGGLAVLGGVARVVNTIFAANDNFAVADFVGGTGITLENCLFDDNIGGDYIDRSEFPNIIHNGAAAINSQLAGANGNVEGDPAFFMVPGGTWTAPPTYNAATDRSTFTDTAAAFTPAALRGQLVVLSSDGFQALVLDNTATTITVASDYSAELAAGDPYQIADFRLSVDSAAIDMGRNSSAPSDGAVTVDFDGVARGFDGDGHGATTADGSDYDIGAFESDTEVVLDAITVISPNGGESFARGTLQNISWSSTGNPGAQVRIVARRGTSMAVIAASTPNDGSYAWLVPTTYPTGNNFKVEISAVTTPTILDSSDAFFTVTPAAAAGTITVVTPNGGESYLQGVTVPIAWSSSGTVGANVEILARSGGQSFTVSASTANDGAFDWTVPGNQAIGTDYRIEVRSIAYPTILDSSNAAFSIAGVPGEAGITVLSPNGGETFQRGTMTEIRWSTMGSIGANVRIVARKGTSSGVIASSTPNDGSFNWNIPANYPLGAGMTVEISSVLTPSILDASNGSFTLTDSPPPSGSITVTAPNGGESYPQGATIPVTWISSGAVGTTVQIIAHSGGQNYTVTGSTSNDGAHDWTVPADQVPGTDYTIEVRSISAPTVGDTSNAAFAITGPLPASSITVLAPNGGETFVRGSQTEISWTSTGAIGANVRIVARKGTTSGVISSSTPNDGSYTWTVPANYPLGPGMYIEISSVTTPAILDISNGTFTLIAP